MVCLISRVGEIQFAFVLGGVAFRLLTHVLNFIFAQTRRLLDFHRGLFACAKVFCSDIQNAILIDIKFDFDLRNASRRGRDSLQVELTEQAIVFRHLSLTLKHLNRHRRLVVCRRTEDIFPFGWNRGVPFDQGRQYTTLGFDPKRQRCDVEQQNVFTISGKNSSLNRSTYRNDLIRIDTPMRLLVEDVFDQLLHFGNSSRASYQNHLVDVTRVQFGIAQSLHDRATTSFDQPVSQFFELRTGDVDLKMLGDASLSSDEGQIDFGLRNRAQFFLRLLASFLQSLQGHLVLAEIHPVVLFELIRDVVDKRFVKVVAAQVRVTTGRNHFEDHGAIIVVEFENGDIERTTTKIEDHDFLFVVVLVQSIGHRRRSRFINDSGDF